MKPILACTDGSLYAPSLYQHAAWAAKRDDSLVRVLHVLERDESTRGRDLTGSLGFDAGAELMEELVQLDEAHARVARLRGKAVLEDARKQLTELGVSSVEALQRHGSLVDTVEEFEDDAELVILGKRGEHADFAKGHLGSNLERVVRSAKVPVLVAARAFQPIESFLIAFDGGASALKAVHYAASNPLLKGLKCHLVAVGKPDSDLARELDGAATGLAGAGYDVSAELLQGDPEEVITREVEARGVDLLVMGSYGHSKIRRLFIGSTTTALVRDCHIPVLLFR
ncbi:universal stress protein [Roseibacillus persicicus]|uniref:Universal stress protein UspA n=1 Tax=Roseibacillus persicicus TaxID=454148 RepID=A0A918WP68_9BACT|nr:universal stress protein [Roseibacillus persicicus]GHC67431.1 universal stress protein UspA [Roseibacillus persicicus]